MNQYCITWRLVINTFPVYDDFKWSGTLYKNVLSYRALRVQNLRKGCKTIMMISDALFEPNEVKKIWQETSGVNDWIWPKPFLALVVGRLSGVGAESISSGTLQLFVSQLLLYMQEEIVTPWIGSEDNLLCASKQMRSCVVVKLKREESEEF